MKFKSVLSVFSALTIAVSAIAGDWTGVKAKAYDEPAVAEIAADPFISGMVGDDVSVVQNPDDGAALDDTASLDVYDANLSFDPTTGKITWDAYRGPAAGDTDVLEIYHVFFSTEMRLLTASVSVILRQNWSIFLHFSRMRI